jgi:hypothetical protein
VSDSTGKPDEGISIDLRNLKGTHKQAFTVQLGFFTSVGVVFDENADIDPDNKNLREFAAAIVLRLLNGLLHHDSENDEYYAEGVEVDPSMAQHLLATSEVAVRIEDRPNIQPESPEDEVEFFSRSHMIVRASAEAVARAVEHGPRYVTDPEECMDGPEQEQEQEEEPFSDKSEMSSEIQQQYTDAFLAWARKNVIN